MSDISQLMQVAPMVGAHYAGINQGQNEQMQQAKLQELLQMMESRQMEAQQKSAMHPLELESARLKNQTSQAQLPGISANSELLAQKAKFGRETIDGDIEADQVEKKMKVYKTLGSSLGNVAGVIESNSTVPPHAAFASELQNIGIPQGAAQRMIQKYSSVPASQLAAKLREDAERMLRQSEAYVQNIDREKLQQAGATERAKLMAQNRVEVKGMGGGGSKNPDLDDLEAWLQIELKGKPPATQFAILNRYIIRAEDSGNEELAARLRRQALALKPQVDAQINSPRAGGVDLGTQSQGRIQTHPPADLPVAGQQGAATQSKPGADPTVEIRRRLAGVGQRYEPDKYHYRIGPNGQLQKAPK